MAESYFDSYGRFLFICILFIFYVTRTKTWICRIIFHIVTWAIYLCIALNSLKNIERRLIYYLVVCTQECTLYIILTTQVRTQFLSSGKIVLNNEKFEIVGFRVISSNHKEFLTQNLKVVLCSASSR